MLVRIPKGWDPAVCGAEREVTPESVYSARRKFLQQMATAGLVGLGAAAGVVRPAYAEASAGRRAEAPADTLALPRLQAPLNRKYRVQRPVTRETIVAQYNNFYEFTTDKQRVWKLAERFQARPWEIEVRGQVEKRLKFDVDDLLRQMPLEERIYRLRCVEAWSVVVPWVGFPMKKFIEWVKPTAKARYVRMVSFYRPAQAPGQAKETWYPWPYFEGLTMAEAMNELTMLVVGSYGHILPNQNGAPIRLIVPWKYGFKSIKSIVRFEFVEKQPRNFWHVVAPQEYDFFSNVNPALPHARWSQATETDVASGRRIPTRSYNGYGEFVAHLYR
ncbi:MAG: protein-methionine-sulfoxide reductase catalytic subunit MsrP [Terriglobia bacterium]